MKQDHIEQLETLMIDLADIRHRFIRLEGKSPVTEKWPSSYRGILQALHETTSDIADFLAEYLRQERHEENPERGV